MQDVYAGLSFAQKTEAGLAWIPNESGDWAKDNATGRAYADQLVGRMTERSNPAMLAHVVTAISARGIIAGVETGFFTRIAALTIN